MATSAPLPDVGDPSVEPLQARTSLGAVAAISVGEIDAAHAPGLWITDAGPQADSDVLWDMSSVDWVVGPQRWEADGEHPGDIDHLAVMGAEPIAGDDLFGNGWAEAGMAAGWYWGDEWGGDWCEVWQCEGTDWMLGADGLYANGEGQGVPPEDGAWQQDVSSPWEANSDPQRWQDRRPDGARPYRQGLGPGAGKWPRPIGRSHVHVPRRLNLEERFRDRGGAEEVTTLMIRNVPNRYDRSMLMQELDFLGFQGKYDFLYLPIDNATHWNVGYAFVNFDEPQDAERCMQVLEGHQFLKFRHSKKRVAQVSIAHIQGLEQNLAHCSGTSVFSVPHPWLRPWVRRRPAKQADIPKPYDDSQRCRTPQDSDCDGQAGEALQRWENGINQLLDEEAREDERSCSPPEQHHPAQQPASEPRVDNSTVELRISSGTNEAVWTRVVQHVLSSGARRLKLLPSSPISHLIGAGGAGLPPAVRSTLQAIADLPELAQLEVEVAAEGESIVLSPSQLREQLGLPCRPSGECGRPEAQQADTPAHMTQSPNNGSVAGGAAFRGHKDGSIRGVSLPPEGVRSYNDARSNSQLRSGSLNSWRRTSRNNSRPPRRRGAGGSASVGASRRQSSVARAAWGPRPVAPASPQPGEGLPEPLSREVDSWPALGSSVASAVDVVWPHQPQQAQQQHPQQTQKPQSEEIYQTYTAATPWALPDGAEAWPGNLGSVATLPESDIRLCYLCPHDWMENATWDLGMAGMGMGGMTDADCGQEVCQDPNMPQTWCNASTEETTSTGDPESAASPPEGSDAAAHVDSTSCSDICNESDLKACEPVTTLMIRNIPANYSQDMLFRELEALGLHLACNFVYLPYLPMDSVMPWNIGCAFVNFWTPDDAERARSVLAGHVWEDYVNGTRKVADVADALIQGSEANIQHYNLTAVKDVNWESTAQAQVSWNWGGSSPGSTCTPDFASMPRSPPPDHIPDACPDDLPKDPPPSVPPSVEVRNGRAGSWSVLEREISRTPSPELHHHSCAPHHHLATSSSPSLGPEALDSPALHWGEMKALGRRRSRSPPPSAAMALPPAAQDGASVDLLPPTWSQGPPTLSAPPPPPAAPPAPPKSDGLSVEGGTLPPLPAHTATANLDPSEPDAGGEAALPGQVLECPAAVPRGAGVGPRVRCAVSPGPAAAKAPKERAKWTKMQDDEDADEKGDGEEKRPLGIEEWPSLGGGFARRRKSSRCPRSRIPRSEIVDGTVR